MSPKLLIVEDDSDDVTLILLGFRLQNFEPHVVVAKDGKEAIGILLCDREASRPLPEVILTDIKMPRMDGLELLRRLKSEPRLREITIVILTSSDHEADRKEALNLGVTHYFLKPQNLDAYAEIVSSIRRLMEAGTRHAGVGEKQEPL